MTNFSQVKYYATCAGFKTDTEDLGCIVFPENSVTVGVFTQNLFIAAPVSVCKKHLSSSSAIRGLLINSGNANCGNGEEGMEVCRQSCVLLSDKIGCSTNAILPFSTGVINEPISLKCFQNGIQKLIPTSVNLERVAKAIMTTDTRPKIVNKQFEIDGQIIEISGIAKGAGMIQPNMATMLAFVWTNANIDKENLQLALNQAVDQSFNCITVDGDTSTNDSCTLTATGSSDISLTHTSSHWEEWQSTLNQVFIELAQAIVLDGEGATKFVTVEVIDGHCIEDCRKVGFTIANSPLVKTALFAEDPNLGRIAAAVGRAGVVMDFDKVKIWLDELLVMENGQLSADYSEPKAQKIMQKKAFSIKVSLSTGDNTCKVWTTDLSDEYVRINSDYRS
jgi:glutamate N-acetyltransferase/amino-acid N-acetyltransferase